MFNSTLWSSWVSSSSHWITIEIYSDSATKITYDLVHTIDMNLILFTRPNQHLRFKSCISFCVYTELSVHIWISQDQTHIIRDYPSKSMTKLVSFYENQAKLIFPYSKYYTS